MTADDINQKALNEPSNVSEIGSDPQGATPDYKRHPFYSPSEWLLESISAFLALGLLIGIAIIFWYMDNKPLDDWTGRVSLNATISILTTACTTLLMHSVSSFIGQSKWLHFKSAPRKLSHLEIFDGASRGVWGSILLLANIPWNLAAIGAFITILRLAFSPFAQQVVLIQQREVITPNENVTFGYAHNYTRDMPGAVVTFQSIPQDPGMQSAIYQGLYDLDIAEPFRCSAACQWSESYISLGFKSDCKNVTEATLDTSACAKPAEKTYCNMTTPMGLDIQTERVDTASATGFYLNARSLQINRTGINRTLDLPEIARFAIYRSSVDSNFFAYDENVTECSLSLTAYEYAGAKANGSSFAFEQKREVDIGDNSAWGFCGPMSTGFSDRLCLNATRRGGIDIPALEINFASLAALGNFFISPAISTAWIEGSYYNHNLGVAAALSGNVNLTDRFDMMANAMTDHVRYGPNTQTARGDLVERVPFVSIRWGYFVVPIVTEGFAILFAILSIINNRKSRNIPLWKSSSLAVLECHHEERLGLLHTTGRDLNEIQADAEKAKARLQ
ncbi:hypothetical protein BJY01DRAFT_234169 [Aspergillus pseudoustus]|uniref:Uncharacterized protein n=1 Tax=Aspergillus pseudoustus TaxID=1810923 RepID=A0ABR4K640_9EURO